MCVYKQSTAICVQHFLSTVMCIALTALAEFVIHIGFIKPTIQNLECQLYFISDIIADNTEFSTPDVSFICLIEI